jgi:hypothetical protein
VPVPTLPEEKPEPTAGARLRMAHGRNQVRARVEAN